jgi:urease accessory protein
MKKISAATLSPLCLLALPGLARAHHVMGGGLPETFTQGLLSGLGHPVIGADHAAFIVAAGFVLALVNRGAWGVLALIAGSLLGAALHLSGTGIPGLEIGIASSVIVAGGLLVARRLPNLSWLLGGLVLAGALHGYAYAETIFGAEPGALGAYLLGFSAIQLAVAFAAFFAHRQILARRAAFAPRLAGALGAVVGAVGIAFLASNLMA